MPPGMMAFRDCIIEGAVRAGVARSINHSCAPNLLSVEVIVPWGPPVVMLVAQRPIRAGEQLTLDYSPDKTKSDLAELHKKNQAVSFGIASGLLRLRLV